MNHFVAIRSEGALIPLDTIDKLLRGGLPGQKPTDFGLERSQQLGDEIARAWSDALDYWHIFRRRTEALSNTDPGTTLTRDRWVLRVLTDLLGYELAYQPAGAYVSGKTYAISHRAGSGEEAPPVHIVGFRQDLDRRDEAGHRRMSPQALVQEYINRSEHLWGVVTNGLCFRLLRDTTRTSRPTYLEFDLQSILEAGRFNEFVVFYRLCHRTRLPQTIDEAKNCLLERYYQASIDDGRRVRDRLRDAVEVALKKIGTGLLQHPSNDVLRGVVNSGKLPAELYYRELLHLIYRLLFLMVAEERQMVLVLGPEAERHQQTYDRLYSLRRLRDLAERPIEESPHGDLWIGLQETFCLFTNGRENPLGIPPLNGHLFGPDAIPNLEGRSLYNHDLLVALRRMSVSDADGAPSRVNYAGLDVEELGSVYESLLDFHPEIERGNGTVTFDLKIGTERKSTGSYYTPRELVAELIESALAPVLEDRVARAASREQKQHAILSMTVCDPACGSGHFLLAAARRMARELARVRSGEDEPTPDDFRRALRDVIQLCLYGVDKNPLAVDLCKVALWIDGHNPGLPLSFLDHHIKCGDSLVGILSLDRLTKGIPDDAYTAVPGDDKTVARELRQRNARESKSSGRQLPLSEDRLREHSSEYATAYSSLLSLPQDTVEQVHRTERRYKEIHGEGSSWWREWSAANLFVGAFFLPLTNDTKALVPTTEHVRDWLAEMPLIARMAEETKRLAVALHFLHWPLEFPVVFDNGGFDVVLGNPPWEQVETTYGTGASIHGEKKFYSYSGRFPLSAGARKNTYALFTELALRLLRHGGRAGFIVPTGIATDEPTQSLWQWIVHQTGLVSLLDFENRKKHFADLDSRYRFCLLTVSASSSAIASRFACYLHSVEDWGDARRTFTLSESEMRKLNPLTGSLPSFRTRQDKDLLSKTYESSTTFFASTTTPRWPIVAGLMFNYEKRIASRKLSHEATLEMERDSVLRVYEGETFHAYDHRFATFDPQEGDFRRTTTREQADRSFSICTATYLPAQLVHERISTLDPGYSRHWLIALRRQARSTDERSMISAVVPFVAVEGSATVLLPRAEVPARLATCLLANLNTLVLDYVVRAKMGNPNINRSVYAQLPILDPSTYTDADVKWIAERVARLSYTSWDLEGFAEEVGCNSEPNLWNEDERSLLRAQLDAYYAHLYKLERDELRFVLDPKDLYGEDFPGETFRVLKESEERAYREYRTKRLILEEYDELAKTTRFGSRITLVTPPRPLRENS